MPEAIMAVQAGLQVLGLAALAWDCESTVPMTSGIGTMAKREGLMASRLLETIEKCIKRVDELKAEEKKTAKELADLEKVEFTIEGFQKKRMEMIEQAVNGRFSFVKFKLFETLVTGGEVPCFKTMVHGVPYSDANRAGQINAGIDIINALSATYGITAPIIIDNAECVNDFQPTEAQTIRLYVTKDPVLTIN